ncbi:MAG: 1-(5-phosphoribosyl)-5-[(5-phosphoribosylamino)methylideneamino]imidazole-4-carboxamide isomerase [Proteobacteria bacterium]|nr:1-(5-phosphoribosyl)-5-[(5-phosphoribosylamino)methylideneamino]imidazole-4-carboxamide isomerase [Pseudomonadota bacterium]
MSFIVYPAIDVRDGRVVRLRQGDYAQETRYDADPFTQAVRYSEAGANWLHLVDLDAARGGGYTLAPLLRSLSEHTGLHVQTGGGVREEKDVEAILEAGAQRVVIGSLAVREPERVLGWLRVFGAEHLTIALDTRREENGEWRLPVHGWTESSTQTLFDLAALYADAGLRHLLCTDISRDGMLSGPSLDVYGELCRRFPQLQVQASGGIRDAGDISAARAAGCAGAVLGKSLLDGRLSLQDALRC